jgi:hypothetical protein
VLILPLSEFWATTNFLYDPSERLYFRDSRFFELREANGPKVFWSRGNGWVFAGMARMMEALPLNDPDRRRLQALFQKMAGRVKDLQKADGYLAASPVGARGFRSPAARLVGSRSSDPAGRALGMGAAGQRPPR